LFELDSNEKGDTFMQPTLCSKCHKNIAVIFVSRIENGETKNDGLCLKCARSMGIKPIDDMMKRMGISDEDLDNMTEEMMNMVSNGEGLDGLIPQDNQDADDGDGEEDEGKTATFPFLNRLFGPGNQQPAVPPEEGGAKQSGREKGKSGKKKFLDNYCINLTNRARGGQLDGVIGRDEEIQRVIQILNRRQKNNPCLIGEPGVGKTAIAEGLAIRIASGDVPYKLQDKEVYLLDLTALVAGTQFRGQFESRMKGLIEEIRKAGNVILVIDEIHNIVGAGDAEGSMNAANILKPALSRGEIQVIGATTFTEYRKHIEKDTALERRFQPVTVNEPSIEDSVKIIKGIAHFYENYHCVRVTDAVAYQTVVMSERYITDRFLPDKAIDLLDEACSDVNLHNANLSRLAAVKKERADLEREKEMLLGEVSKQDELRNDALTENEQKQARARQELSALNQARRTILNDLSMSEDTRRSRLETNDARRADLQRTLDALAEERQSIQTQQADRSFERLAIIRSQDMRLEQEQHELESVPWPQLNVENLARVIEQWTGIPASRIQEAEFGRLAHLSERLKEHIIGQDKAIDAVTAAIRRNRVGISPKHKPVSFIFVGSTGVGKTELVKQLAQDLFHSPDALIRLDMSEFMEKHSVSRLIGSPPGYIGYDEAGQLTEKIRRKPYAVILFDEIEKAHPDVLNVLLQILDDGRVTDAHGRTVNFENTVIIMTSNAGSERKESAVGFGHSVNELDEERTLKALQSFLRPEFINRVDEIVHFNRLTEENFKGITRIMLGELTDSLEEKGVTFTYDDALVEYLTHKSYSLTYGARNLRRLIQRELEDAIASRIIDSYEHPISQLHATAADEQIQLDCR
jgi:ATP-dependent Clp protease ATP-binding subunit ClpB